MQVGEIRPATVDDFKQLLDIVFSHEGWDAKPDKGGVRVWTKSNSSSPVKMIKLAVDFEDVSAITLYDVLHDPNYRVQWDESMIEGLDIYKLDDFNDIGYYSLRCPPPMKNRDFVNQRSWGVFGDDHMIMNHTIDIEEMPVKKDFIRGVSYLTGYVVRRQERGCSVHYITQNDPGGNVPKWLLNRISSVIAPKVLEKIYKAALSYESWKSKNDPEWRPWRGIGKDAKPLWPKYKAAKISNSTLSLDGKVKNSTEKAPTLPNGTGEQYGSLDSLAPVPNSETSRRLSSALNAEMGQQRSTVAPAEIIGNVFSVPPEKTEEEAAHRTQPPLLRHESISIRQRGEEDNSWDTAVQGGVTGNNGGEKYEADPRIPPEAGHLQNGSKSRQYSIEEDYNAVENHMMTSRTPTNGVAGFQPRTDNRHPIRDGQNHVQFQQNHAANSPPTQFQMNPTQMETMVPNMHNPPYPPPSQSYSAQYAAPNMMYQNSSPYHGGLPQINQQSYMPQQEISQYQHNPFPHSHNQYSSNQMNQFPMHNPYLPQNLPNMGQVNQIPPDTAQYNQGPLHHAPNHSSTPQIQPTSHNPGHDPRNAPKNPASTPGDRSKASSLSRSEGPNSSSGGSLMYRSDSIETAGSQISDLCYSISQLTKGEPDQRTPTPESSDPRVTVPEGSTVSLQSRASVPPDSFASVTVSTHPIDPDCCSRVSRHVLGVYGINRQMTPSRSHVSSRPAKHHHQQVPTIPEKGEYRSKKKSREPEGLESSSYKFINKLSSDKTTRNPGHHRRKKKHHVTADGEHVADREPETGEGSGNRKHRHTSRQSRHPEAAEMRHTVDPRQPGEVRQNASEMRQTAELRQSHSEKRHSSERRHGSREKRSGDHRRSESEKRQSGSADKRQSSSEKRQSSGEKRHLRRPVETSSRLATE